MEQIYQSGIFLQFFLQRAKVFCVGFIVSRLFSKGIKTNSLLIRLVQNYTYTTKNGQHKKPKTVLESVQCDKWNDLAAFK